MSASPRTRLKVAGSLLALVMAVGCQRQTPQSEMSAAPALDQAAMVKRGEYLVSYGGCHDCHTPWKMGPNGPEPDMARALSGHPEALKISAPFKPTNDWMAAVTPSFTAWSGPWGISYTANLTPDQNTGMGIWDEAMFLKTMRGGRHMGDGRPILPPMPWQALNKLTDEDLKAVFAYLRSIPPIVNRVPDAIINEPPPAN